MHCSRARYELKSSARVPPLINRGELEIVLPVDYEILGKCTYVRKKQDGVSSPKQVPPARPPAGHPVMKLSVVGTIYLRKREESSLLGGRQWGGRGGTFRTAHSVLLLTYVGALT